MKIWFPLELITMPRESSMSLRFFWKPPVRSDCSRSSSSSIFSVTVAVLLYSTATNASAPETFLSFRARSSASLLSRKEPTLTLYTVLLPLSTVLMT